ncbi:MAG: hypothetical protein GXP62_16270 [Oligoflexia bacterium]|nr:hypothetical protein [Oligoflexia bacterium]
MTALAQSRPAPPGSASGLHIEEVRSPRQLSEFLALPQRIHQGDPAFVPPIRAWLRRRLSRRNPFLSEADLRLFLARRDGQVVGTISALRDPRHEQVHQQAVAFFGFFCCEDELATAQALLDRVREVAKGWGSTLLRGPRDLSRIESMGITVQGYDRPPPFLAGHHPRYARQLIERLGLRKHHDVLAYDIQLYDESGPRPIPPKLERKAAAVDIPGLSLQPLRWSRWRKDLDLAHTVFVDAFRDVPDNTPMPREQFVGLGGGLLLLTRRHMLQLATVHGQAAGFALCFPEVNQALIHARGRLFPLGALRALAALRTVRTASFKLLGVLPEYRQTGLHAAMIKAAIEGVRTAGYRRLEASLIDQRNGPMRAIVEGAGMNVYRRYRIYETAL